jgi:hypothetical protein
MLFKINFGNDVVKNTDNSKPSKGMEAGKAF